LESERKATTGKKAILHLAHTLSATARNGFSKGFKSDATVKHERSLSVNRQAALAKPGFYSPCPLVPDPWPHLRLIGGPQFPFATLRLCEKLLFANRIFLFPHLLFYCVLPVCLIKIPPRTPRLCANHLDPPSCFLLIRDSLLKIISCPRSPAPDPWSLHQQPATDRLNRLLLTNPPSPITNPLRSPPQHLSKPTTAWKPLSNTTSQAPPSACGVSDKCTLLQNYKYSYILAPQPLLAQSKKFPKFP
jgi:hypothetical protein